MGNRNHRFNMVVTKKSRERQRIGCEDSVFVSSYIERRQADESSEKAQSQRINGD